MTERWILARESNAGLQFFSLNGVSDAVLGL
jgi:hypothetical protein